MVAQKIATCCYCGTKAALILRGKDSHELSCGRSADPWHSVSQKPTKKMKTQKKSKKKKGFSFMKAAFDVIEDVFDDILD